MGVGVSRRGAGRGSEVSAGERRLSSTGPGPGPSGWGRRRLSRVAAACAVPLLLMACERSGVPPVTDSATASVPASDTAVPAEAVGRAGSTWERDAGLVLLLPTVDGGVTAGSLVRPDAVDSTVADTVGLGVELGDGRLELFARDGLVGTARVAAELARGEQAECPSWPIGRLTLDGAPGRPWTAGFAADRITPIVLDSIEGLSSRDSSTLAARLSRLASALPDDTSAVFRGLPFVVLRAWRAQPTGAAGVPPFVVAMLVRRVNQEAMPLEERLVLVVDLPDNDLRRATVGWSERAAGREDELVVAEPLLAYRLRTGGEGVRLLFARDDGLSLSAAVLQREAAGWRVLWQSAIAGCG